MVVNWPRNPMTVADGQHRVIIVNNGGSLASECSRWPIVTCVIAPDLTLTTKRYGIGADGLSRATAILFYFYKNCCLKSW